MIYEISSYDVIYVIDDGIYDDLVINPSLHPLNFGWRSSKTATTKTYLEVWIERAAHQEKPQEFPEDSWKQQGDPISKNRHDLAISPYWTKSFGDHVR